MVSKKLPALSVQDIIVVINDEVAPSANIRHIRIDIDTSTDDPAFLTAKIAFYQKLEDVDEVDTPIVYSDDIYFVKGWSDNKLYLLKYW